MKRLQSLQITLKMIWPEDDVDMVIYPVSKADRRTLITHLTGMTLECLQCPILNSMGLNLSH